MSKANLLCSVLAALVLVTSTAGCAAITGQETPGEYIDDATISTKVRASLVRELGLSQISVETMQNVVQLSGFVDSPETRARAGEIARGVSGVKSVKNDVIVR